MKKIAMTVMLSIGLTSVGCAIAHGAKPKYDGVVATAGDLQFELSDKDGKPVIYVEDHGNKLSTAGTTGKMTLLSGAEKKEIMLAPAGENLLQASEYVKLAKGTKAIASITFPDKRVVNVRFSIR